MQYEFYEATFVLTIFFTLHFFLFPESTGWFINEFSLIKCTTRVAFDTIESERYGLH
jgi:hypothetical protein